MRLLVAPGPADQRLKLLVIGVGAHVETLERPLQPGSSQLRQQRLAHPRGAGEDETGARRLALDLRRRDQLAVEQPFDEGVHRVILAEQPGLHRRAQSPQPVG